MLYFTEASIIAMPLTNADRQTAQQFAQQQLVPEKAEQVYRNTLAVLAVDHYFQLLEIPTDLKACDSWNPVSRLGTDVADLVLPGIGCLECRPVEKNAQECLIPPEVWRNRLGYVVVQLNEDYREGKILGFVKAIAQPNLSLGHLESLDELMDHLAAMEKMQITNLRKWLMSQFEEEWKPIEAVLNTSEAELAFRFRGEQLSCDTQKLVEQIYQSPDESMRRIAAERLGNLKQAEPDVILALAHLIQTTEDEETRWSAAESLWMIDPGNPIAGMRRVMDLGMQLAGHAIALLVAIIPKGKQETAVLLRVYPMNHNRVLPSEVELALLDENGKVASPPVKSREQDNCIQLKLYGKSGDQFSVRVTLAKMSITKNFVL
jgi:hypothetical protein